MKNWRYYFIIAIILYCVWELIPSVRYYSMPAKARTEQREKYVDSIIKLGLDLQGGMHLVLEVDDTGLSEDARKDALDRAIRVIRNRIDQFGVSEPVIQKQGDHRIIVQLPGLQDADRAKELIGRTALLELRLVRDNQDLGAVLRDLDTALKGVEAGSEEADTTGTTAADTTGAESVALADTTDLNEPSPFDTLIPDITGTEDVAGQVPEASVDRSERPFTSYLLYTQNGVYVDEKYVPTVKKLLATPEAKHAVPRQDAFLWAAESQPIQGGGTGRYLYFVERNPTLTGANLVNATTRPDPDDPSSLNVSFQLDREGALIFSRWTGENIGRRIAIVLDSLVFSAPVVQTKIPGGEGRITGSFTDDEANDLAIVLRAGALPVPIEIKEERTVGPTLGRDSIILGVRAAVVGFVLVMIFMVIYYKASGLLACIALVLNLGIVLAVLAALRAALTLPGIAGLILTIGMAVDANVLIFERIREELAKAKTVRSAIDSGYERAFTTILDANLTTLITAFVLWQFGTGPIKGFATTLSIGIVASMFTALMCTRMVYQLITTRRQLRKLSI